MKNSETIEGKSSEELGLILGQQYQLLMQAQQGIIAINKVLEQRKEQNDKRETKQQS